MRRQIALLMTFLLASVALVSGQEGDVEPAIESTPIHATQQTVTGAWVAIELEPVSFAPFAPNAPGAEDACIDAPELSVPDTGVTITNDMDKDDPTDPVLACMWGTSNSKGYRTAWYKFIPRQSGKVTLNTVGSNYDTVLSVYSSDNSNSCSNLVQIACNDDANFFTSQVTLPVFEGHTYYVEVADWHKSPNGVTELYVSTKSAPFSSNWQVESDAERTEPFRSRHVVVVVGEDIYIISGQTVVGEDPVRTRSTVVYHTTETDPDKVWEELAPMWGDTGYGYSNTTAAFVEGNIYIPSGYDGVDGDYDGTHWIYDIDLDRWEEGPTNDWGGNPVPIYSAAISYERPTEKGYFVIGGLTGPFPDHLAINYQARDEMYFFSATHSAWSQRTWPSLLRGRFGHSAVLQNIDGSDHICVSGGFGKSVTIFRREALDSAECYDVESDAWRVISPMNRPRYFHSSAVDSKGNWYVWGGIDDLGRIVSTIEKYDRGNDSWIDLDISFDLTDPARAWSRGDFIDQTLWIVGGETLGGDVINRIETLRLPDVTGVQPFGYLPVVFNDLVAFGEPDDTLASARPLLFDVPKAAQYFGPEDYVDVFYFYLPNPGNVTTKLAQLPLNSEYIMYLYRDNKVNLGSKNNLGGLEMSMTQYLTSGRYFVVVERKLPTPSFDPYPQPFEISVSK